MKLNGKLIWLTNVLIALILVCGNTTLANVEGTAGVDENMISEEMQAVDEEMIEPEPTDINTVDEEMAGSESSDLQAVTIIGTVADDYVLISKQGILYVIAETEAGDEMGQYVGEEVIVKGIISGEDDQKYISVTVFEFVKK